MQEVVRHVLLNPAGEALRCPANLREPTAARVVVNNITFRSCRQEIFGTSAERRVRCEHHKGLHTRVTPLNRGRDTFPVLLAHITKPGQAKYQSNRLIQSFVLFALIGCFQVQRVCT